MITKKTVLVLGAGASMPFKFPSGDQLVDSVNSALAHSPSHPHKLASPGYRLTTVDILMALGHGQEEIPAFTRDLQDAQVRSIDAFLERRRDHVALGKAAIAIEIHRQEHKQHLLNKRDHWYQFLLDTIDGPFDEIPANQLSIVTYNYDRSLEAYLVFALSARHNRSYRECAEMVSKIPIVHLHGSLGKLKWDDEDQGLPYHGHVLNVEAVRQMSASMIVIHEGQDDSIEYREALQLMTRAERIYCIGFGYGRTNLQRLRLHDHAGRPGKVIGSYREITTPERRRVEGPGPFKVKLVQCADCSDFIRNVDLD